MAGQNGCLHWKYCNDPVMGRDYRHLSGSILLLISLCITTSFSTLINGDVLSSRIKSFTDTMGFAAIKQLYSDAPSSSSTVEGVSLVTEISATLGEKFNGPVSAAKAIKQSVESEESQFSSTLLSSQCCEGVGVSYSSKFKTQVALDKSCIQISRDATPDRKYPTQAIENVMRENAQQNPNLKWQYFASEDGYYLSWPSVKQTDCSNYDPRFRPFYVATATPVHKDVVVIIDRSGSMASTHNGVTLMKIAQDAANTVLETLNPNDRVSVVAFESTAEIVGSSSRECFRTELAQATPLNLNYLKTQINSITPRYSTNYEDAFSKAFQVLSASPPLSHEQVILLLTDGKKTAGGDPLTTIAARNQALGNRVMIFTYALGNSFEWDDKRLLENIAIQSQSNPAYGAIKPGEFKQILNPDLLRSSMGSYYNRFSSNQHRSEPIFTVPYIDLFGLGLITSVCLPVYRGLGDLMGVACSDVTMSDLLSDITYFSQGELSYAFIIDQYGRTFMHPQLPQISSVQDDPIFVHIDHLERSSGAATVIQDMLGGTTDTSTFMSDRTIPRGSVLYEGIETRSIRSTYAWGKVPNSNLSIAIVVGEGDSLARFQNMPTSADVFHYHRLDLNLYQASFCKHFNRYATKDFSITMLTPGAFKDPASYLNTEETRQIIQSYESFLRGTTTVNPGFKESVINSVALTYRAENMWKTNRDQGQLVIWRYIGTTDCVMRLYPGAQLPKFYDHTRRPWFIRSVALKGKLVFSSPYLDQWSKGYIITVSTTIQESGTNTPVVAVAGTDFRVPYMYQLLLGSYSVCSLTSYSCFVVDSSGLVVVHQDFVKFTGEPMIENMHIIKKEPAIAANLINNGYMTKTSCLDFGNIKEQFSYRIVISGSIDRLSGYSTAYEIHPVADTNIYVVIKRSSTTSSSSSCCTSYGIAPNQQQCGSISCDCLCYKETFYDYCLDRYPLLSDAAPTCSPQPPDLVNGSISETDRVKDLSICFNADCSRKQTVGKCHNVSGCSWCYLDEEKDDLSEPFCGTFYKCLYGVLLKCDDCDDDDDFDVVIIAIVIIAVFGIVFVVGTVIGVVIWKKYHTRVASNRVQTLPRGVAYPVQQASPRSESQPMATFASAQHTPSAPPLPPPSYEEAQRHANHHSYHPQTNYRYPTKAN